MLQAITTAHVVQLPLPCTGHHTVSLRLHHYFCVKTHAVLYRTAPYPQYLATEAQRLVAKARGKKQPPVFAPSFAEGVRHFLLHAGGWQLGRSLCQNMNIAGRF